jgi:hypothetical protein
VAARSVLFYAAAAATTDFFIAAISEFERKTVLQG